jgi:RsiW-degrading membrane proteinase PrsW (M82 family)
MHLAIKGIISVLTALFVLVVVVIALAPHVLLAWAVAYPAAYTRHDPHHWLVRLAALGVVLVYGWWSLGEGSKAWRTFRDWQSAFLPWKRRLDHKD